MTQQSPSKAQAKPKAQSPSKAQLKHNSGRNVLGSEYSDQRQNSVKDWIL